MSAQWRATSAGPLASVMIAISGSGPPSNAAPVPGQAARARPRPGPAVCRPVPSPAGGQVRSRRPGHRGAGGRGGQLLRPLAGGQPDQRRRRAPGGQPPGCRRFLGCPAGQPRRQRSPVIGRCARRSRRAGSPGTRTARARVGFRRSAQLRRGGRDGGRPGSVRQQPRTASGRQPSSRPSAPGPSLVTVRVIASHGAVAYQTDLGADLAAAKDGRRQRCSPTR